MSGNTIGTIFRVTTFGESHGEGLGVIIDGCPAGIKIDIDAIQKDLDRRRPGAKNPDGKQNAAVTARSESDKAEILSGVYNGFSEGTPIAIFIKNTSQHSKDYGNLAKTFRPGHADFSYFEKYGFRDYRGGGRSSGRETSARVAAGAIAKMVLKNIFSAAKITAYTLKAAGIQCEKIDFSEIEKNPLRAADSLAAEKMLSKIEELRRCGNSAGGIIECTVKGIPSGLGEPVFDKLDAELAKAMLSIGAVKGIEFGKGFSAADSTGIENNDKMEIVNDKVSFLSNNAGGILGGISNGNDIIFRIAVKPVPSVFSEQQTIQCDTNAEEPCFTQHVFNNTQLKIAGRHDVCLCPRIVPVVEAMTAITLADMCLRNRSSIIR